MSRKHEPRMTVINRLPHPSLSPSIGRTSVAIGPGHRPSEDDVRTRAYERWEAAGRPEGDGLQFWLEAEHELDRSEAAS
jgi:hypothetical protein